MLFAMEKHADRFSISLLPDKSSISRFFLSINE
jgi:hypothetical protein